MLRKYIPNITVNIGKHLPMAVLANIKYGFPGRKINVIGVTGTDGKTTTVNMIYNILKSAGKRVSMVSTINANVAGRQYDTGFHVTSPKSSMIQKFLADSVKKGDEFFILEVTSHALDQFRTWGIPIEIGVITNITHEHLDYHKTFENYLSAKSKLISKSKLAVLNRDDENFNRLQKVSTRVVSFGLHNNSDLNPKNFPLKLKIPGEYNVLNALAAAAVARAVGIEDRLIKKSLESFNSLSGRMEEVPNKLGLKVVVDFAHTPNSLENALKTLRTETERSSRASRTKGRLISVFGCASQRDIQKRPIMGQISAKLADITILTDEDPRHEPSLEIINQIASGAKAIGAKINESLYIQPDRQKAIDLAISLAKKGDAIGVFGKGHERSMNYKGKELPWSDFAAVQKALGWTPN
jgi:UDP-N-acetylmuramoyl-L-alanyl-D-glutamate--2,6-diaminopimelate ligase